MSVATETSSAFEQSLQRSDASTPYAFGVRVPYGHDAAVNRVREVLKAQGFGILTEINVQQTMKDKIGYEMGKYLILGACNPPLAHRGLLAEKELGALLPCNVVVYEDPDAAGETVVIAQDPRIMMAMIGNPSLEPVAQEARHRLMQAFHELGGTPR